MFVKPILTLRQLPMERRENKSCGNEPSPFLTTRTWGHVTYGRRLPVMTVITGSRRPYVTWPQVLVVRNGEGSLPQDLFSLLSIGSCRRVKIGLTNICFRGN